MELFRNILNSGLDPSQHSSDELRRFRYVNVALLTISILSAPYPPYYWWLDSPVTVAVVSAAIVLSLSGMLYLRHDRRPERVGFAATGVVYAALLVANIDAGGVLAVASPWWLVVPTFGTLVGGARSGLFWCIATLAAVFGLAVSYQAGMLPPSHGPDVYFDQACAAVVGSTLINFIISVAFVHQYAMAQTLMEDSMERLREEVARRAIAEEEARAASDTRARFLAMMSHEIRTPLHGVQGMNQLLQETPLQPEQQRMVSVALAATRSLRTVLDDVLDFSKLDAAKVTLERIPFPLRGLVHDIVELFANTAKEKGLELRCEIDPAIPEHVRGDPNRLRQVIANLISNALKFTERGEIRLRVQPVDDRLLFEVSDTGIGIAAASLARLFQPFTQAEESTTRRFGGTGLGLSIGRELVRLMDGEIEVDSEEGVGTTFRFAIPLPEARMVELDATTVDTGRPLRVLVADDNQVNQMVVRTLLERDGHHAVIVDDGAAALTAMESTSFDVVFLDLLMPRMGGLEAAAKIRALYGRNSAVPIVALTASAGAEDRAACLTAGMDDVLVKPFVFNDFRRMLARCAEGMPGTLV